MHTLREALHEALAQLSEVFFERLIVKKLREQGLEPTTRLTKKLAKHILSAKKGQFWYRSKKLSSSINLTFSKTDAAELTRPSKISLEINSPSFSPPWQASKRILKDLKAR